MGRTKDLAMTYQNTLCMNGGENCGCAGHCPYWEQEASSGNNKE